MRYPKQTDPWMNICKLGFTSLVSLEPNSFDLAPLRVVFRERLQDLANGRDPLYPDAEKGKIERAVKIGVKELLTGEGVLIHCIGGRGRTGTVIGCILRELGYPATEIINYLDRINKARSKFQWHKPGWPESTWQSQIVRDWLPEDHI